MWKERTGVYYTRIGGRKISLKTKEGKMAKVIEAKFQLEFLEKQHGIKKPSQITFRELSESYLKNLRGDKDKVKDKKDRIEAQLNLNVYPDFGNVPVMQLKHYEIEAFADKKAAKLSKGTANRIINMMRAIVKYGLKPKSDEYATILYDPVQKWPSYRVDGIGKCLSVQEIISIKNADDPEFNKIKNMVIFSLYTGLRRANVIGLKWEWIDFDNGAITFPSGVMKADKAHSIPILPQVREILEKEVGKHEEYVFTLDGHPWKWGSSVTRIFNESKKRIGVRPGVRLHDMRHTCGTTLIQSGRSVEVVKQYLGHADSRTTQRYVHMSQAHMRSELNGWNLDGQNTGRFTVISRTN